MKKVYYFITIVLIIVLSACTQKQVIKVMIPQGGPTYAFLKMMDENKIINNLNIEYETVSGPDLLVSAITSRSHQIVVAPTNVGAKLYNQNSGFVYAGTVSFGNLYLVSPMDKTIDDIKEAKILAFGKGSSPDILLQRVLGHYKVLNKENIDYVTDVSDANLQFATGKYDFVLLAEPVLSLTKKNQTVYEVIDLQEAYKTMTGTNYYPQAGIFVNKEFAERNQQFVKSFLNELQASIEFVNDKQDEAASIYIKNETLKPRLPLDVVKASIPGSNVNYLDVAQSKVLLQNYFNMLYDFNPKTIGDKIPDDDLYLTY